MRVSVTGAFKGHTVGLRCARIQGALAISAIARICVAATNVEGTVMQAKVFARTLFLVVLVVAVVFPLW